MLRVIGTFIAVAVILYLSYLASKYIGKGISRNASSKYMKLIDQIMLGQDKYIAIVQVSEKYFLIGITGAQIETLGELREEELQALSRDEGPGGNAMPVKDFKAMFEKITNSTKKRR